jgi:hypothetical protein
LLVSFWEGDADAFVFEVFEFLFESFLGESGRFFKRATDWGVVRGGRFGVGRTFGFA